MTDEKIKEIDDIAKESKEALKEPDPEELEAGIGNLLFYFGIRIFIITTLVAGSFLIGGIYACESGGGELTGLSCTEPQVIGVCEWEGEYIKIGDVAVRQSLPDGTFGGLSEE